MKLTIVIATLLISVVSCRSLRHNVNEASVTVTPTAAFGYAGGEWIGNAHGIFYVESDCQLSLHVAGRRIDSTLHKPNEDVLISCLSQDPSLDLVIHNFSYDDVQDYTFLEDTSKESASLWLNAAPVIEATAPIVHGQPATLTCNAPLGSPLFWVLPGPEENHQGVVITDNSNAQNASSTITFTVQTTDHFARFNCCIAPKSGQEYLSSCSSYYLNDDDRDGSVEGNADYSSLVFDLRTTVISNPLPDELSVIWRRCSSFGTCNLVYPNNFVVTIDPSSNTLTSRMVISDDTFYAFYNFSVNTTDDVDQYKYVFTVSREYFTPIVTSLPTQIFYNPDTAAASAVLKFTIDSNPEPNVNFYKQLTRQSSIGTEHLTTDGKYAVDVVKVSDTQWEATLIISAFDSSADDAVYTVVAENSVGKSSFIADSTLGPNNFNFIRDTNATATYSFTCSFQFFPGPAAYEINVVSVYDNSYEIVSETYDVQSTQTTVKIEVSVDPQNTYFVISCNALHPYDSSKSRSQTMAVNM
ncbi:hypothetical protein CHUAL_007444 [Chamberlinius hualienensis]